MQAIDTLALNLQNKCLFVMQAIDTMALNLQNKWVFSCNCYTGRETTEQVGVGHAGN